MKGLLQILMDGLQQQALKKILVKKMEKRNPGSIHSCAAAPNLQVSLQKTAVCVLSYAR